MNLPPILPAHLMPIAFSIFASVSPKTADEMFSQGLNHRLGTKGLNIEGLTDEAAKRSMTLEDVMAIPEQDSWIYTGITP